jgi:hypothetical protein
MEKITCSIRKLTTKLHIRHLNGYLDFSSGIRVIAVPNVKIRPTTRKNPRH